MTTQPQPGELWGVAGKTDGYRFVQILYADGSGLWYSCIERDRLVSIERWQEWLTTTGATRLYPPMNESEQPPCP